LGVGTAGSAGVALASAVGAAGDDVGTAGETGPLQAASARLAANKITIKVKLFFIDTIH
jgi:hypothetical protein